MTVYGPDPATVIDVHDGDTTNLMIDLGYGLQIRLACRVFGINAPELSTDAGKAARDFAHTLLTPGMAVHVTSHGWDKYGGRFDGSIILPDGRDFATVMLDSGHAVPMP